MSTSIRKYVSRYVVPFYFTYENNGYERLREHFLSGSSDDCDLLLSGDGQWVNRGFWENYKSDKPKQAEMDIYSYLLSIFHDNSANKKSNSNLGLSLVYRTNGALLKLAYKYQEEYIEFVCKDLGLLLFRNGIGFIWYEVEFGKEPSLDKYVAFQHDFKELARSHQEKITRWVYNGAKDQNPKVYEPFCLGKWLYKILGADELGIRFLAEREVEQEDGDKVRIPDKALLFQYLFVEETTEDESSNIVFRVANGYDEKYSTPKDIDKKLYIPFANTCFYISKAGMACLVNNVGSNETFFDGQFKEKYIRDYFLIYMLLMYQSYSCTHYSRLLTKLPADEKHFNNKDVDKLESLSGQINLFLVKSAMESVSNIEHQNGIYRYGKALLCIEEDINSLMVGLDALKDMEKEKRNRKLNKALTIVAFLALVSVWLDAINLFELFTKNRLYLEIVPDVISIAIIVFAIVLIKRLCKRKKK